MLRELRKLHSILVVQKEFILRVIYFHKDRRHNFIVTLWTASLSSIKFVIGQISHTYNMATSGLTPLGPISNTRPTGQIWPTIYFQVVC